MKRFLDFDNQRGGWNCTCWACMFSRFIGIPAIIIMLAAIIRVLSVMP